MIDVFWLSTNESVAIVDESGLVRAIGGGTALIIATTENGVSASSEVVVDTAVEVENIRFTQRKLTLEEGTALELQAVIQPDNATERTITWQSSDESIVTIDANGVATGVEAGTAIVTVETQNHLSATCEITVVHPWAEVVYTWSEDNQNVTATRVCMFDETHVETETAMASRTLTKAATCEEKGESTYTSAAFKKKDFAVQTKALEDIDALGHDWSDTSYTWSDDNGSVLARRVCGNDETHVERETVHAEFALAKSPTEKEMGETVYTAMFENEHFITQTKVIEDIPSLSQLALFKLPAQLKEIDEEAFMNLPCEGVIVPDGCTSIGSKAFAGCDRLIYVKIPASVKYIAKDAFEGCELVRIDQTDD